MGDLLHRAPSRALVRPAWGSPAAPHNWNLHGADDAEALERRDAIFDALDARRHC